VDDGALPDGAVPDALVLGGGEHGLQRVDAVGEQHPEAVGGAGVVLVDDSPQVNHLQHRLQRLRAVDVAGDRRHPAGGQLRRRHRARGCFWRLPWEGGEERGEEPIRFLWGAAVPPRGWETDRWLEIGGTVEFSLTWPLSLLMESRWNHI